MTLFETLYSIPRQERWRRQKYPIPVVAAIIRQKRSVLLDQEPQSTYLLIKRNSEPYADRWALVGGKWDFGETLAQATMREVKEETGLESASVVLKGLVSERVAPDGGANEGAAHFIIFVSLVDIAGGVAQEQNEGAVAWFTQAEIEQMHLSDAVIPSDYLMIKDFTGESTIPHVEAEMLSSSDQETGSSIARLQRFDYIT